MFIYLFFLNNYLSFNNGHQQVHPMRLFIIPVNEQIKYSSCKNTIKQTTAPFDTRVILNLNNNIIHNVVSICCIIINNRGNI